VIRISRKPTKLPRDFKILQETSANHSADRSIDSGERRKHLKIEECGFLPKAATPVLQRSL